jgi:hypothetical protein
MSDELGREWFYILDIFVVNTHEMNQSRLIIYEKRVEFWASNIPSTMIIHNSTARPYS